MKTTMELPDTLFTTVKVTVASEGISMKEFLTQAIQMRLKMRDYVVSDGGQAEAVTKNAPLGEDHYFAVPKVVE